MRRIILKLDIGISYWIDFFIFVKIGHTLILIQKLNEVSIFLNITKTVVKKVQPNIVIIHLSLCHMRDNF